MLNINQETSTRFQIRRAPNPNGKFYLTREARTISTRAGSLVYFEKENDALEFLAEIGDFVMH